MINAARRPSTFEDFQRIGDYLAVHFALAQDIKTRRFIYINIA